jgi:glucosamine-6-phosphate deaminase
MGGEVSYEVVDRMRVCVHPDPGVLARVAADDAADVLRRAVADRGVAHAMFATGNSQLAFVDALVSATTDVPWSDVVVFHMDEYVGAGPDHPAGFQRWIRERIVDHVRPATAHYLDGRADPGAEAARYSELLRTHPLDLCCLGIGENGHLAFNDPPVAVFDDPWLVKVVELEAACRRQQVNEGHFSSLADVPTEAVTVTIPALLSAATVLAIVPEARKAEPVRLALTGPVSPACPASILRTRPQVTLHLDPGSAGGLDWS